MPKRPIHLTRLRSDQIEEINAVSAFRGELLNLKEVVSQGSYSKKDATHFWNLAGRVSIILQVSNSELAERAGLGAGFFATVVRDKRTPKLDNFLRALTAMIEVANERLHEVESDNSIFSSSKVPARLQSDHAELRSLALSLSRMASEEILKLDAERPNDFDAIAINRRQRELLEIFANGFDRIAQALAALAPAPDEPILLGKANEIVKDVGARVDAWWAQNGSEAVDWTVRIPVFVGGVAALGWAGANMTVGTTAVAALVGGAKVFDVIKSMGRKRRG